MTRLSVNINKIATLRNARGGNNPDVIKAAVDCENFGAQGITVHPRPDERHIRYDDVYKLKEVVKTELNIEGNPNKKFIDLVLEIKPEQVTLVPDSPDILTSNAGWDTVKNKNFLTEIISEFKNNGIRTSIFIETDTRMVENAKLCGTARVELYTEPYAANFHKNKKKAVAPFILAAEAALKNDLDLNAGHDLDLDNLKYFNEQINGLSEVSIGHALICDALYYGLHNTVQMYLRQLK
ncbi:MAG: pyridoxine 5'-phosphate synthase [Bacteroidales bacterium]|nr:pyridoxine 5'-phosphate synthase [Bacteroidales bacterium]